MGDVATAPAHLGALNRGVGFIFNGIDKLIVLSGAPRRWPPYATRTFGILVILCLFAVPFLSGDSEAPKEKKKDGDSSPTKELSKEEKALQKSAFRRFQLSYLTVYLITMLADWLQGTNMYTLYAGYDMPVGLLFITGFTSSAVFGTFVGLYVDKGGRKMGCVLFCVLEIIINTLEHFPSLPLLILGRVLGGVSTSLLFTAFESWMVTEHRSRGFPEEWIAGTFSLASTGNGLSAVAAGILAQLSSDAMGDIGPFRLAIALTVLALAFVLGWTENYGTQDSSEDTAFGLAWGEIRTKTPVMLLGVIQALYEGAMFSFVFVWVPTVLHRAPSTHVDVVDGSVVLDSSPPLGLVFASFMVCITLGGMGFEPLMAKLGLEWATCLVCLVSALSVLVPVATEGFYPTLVAFLVLEACVGCWFACSATMRSKYVDDRLQSSIMTIFRVPLNVLVVVGTRLEETTTIPTVFSTCALWFGLSCVLQAALAGWASGKADTLAAAAADEASKDGKQAAKGNGKKTN